MSESYAEYSQEVYAASKHAKHVRTLLTVRQFSDKHPAFSQGSLRHLIFHAAARGKGKNRIPGNGLDQALIRVGRKLLIDEAKFFEWLDKRNGKGSAQ